MAAVKIGGAVPATAPVPIVKVGGMEFVRFAGGKGRVGSSNFPDNPVMEFTAPAVLVGRDLVPNYEIDAYVAAMAERTHGVVAGDQTGRMHLLSRGVVTDREKMHVETVPEASIVGSPDLSWSAWVSVQTVRVVPPADRLQGLSAAFTDSYSPASRVSLYEALGYCAWKSEMTGKPFMIPDEWLWEWIATNGEGPDRDYPWGNDEPTEDLARFGRTDGPSKIGSHPSEEGVNDLAGNLFEWTMSPFKPGQPYWSVRGGSWNYYAQFLRAAFRSYYLPSNANNFLGFRVVVPQDS